MVYLHTINNKDVGTMFYNIDYVEGRFNLYDSDRRIIGFIPFENLHTKQLQMDLAFMTRISQLVELGFVECISFEDSLQKLIENIDEVEFDLRQVRRVGDNWIFIWG